MRVELTHRIFGVHALQRSAELPGEFADYAARAEPGNEHRDEYVIDDAKLLAALPDGFLPCAAPLVLLGVNEKDGGTAISGTTAFRPWGKYFDAWMIWLASPDAEPMRRNGD